MYGICRLLMYHHRLLMMSWLPHSSNPCSKDLHVHSIWQVIFTVVFGKQQQQQQNSTILDERKDLCGFLEM